MAEEPGLIIRQKKHKVVFMNKELGLRLTELLRLPDGFDLSKNYPAKAGEPCRKGRNNPPGCHRRSGA